MKLLMISCRCSASLSPVMVVALMVAIGLGCSPEGLFHGMEEADSTRYSRCS